MEAAITVGIAVILSVAISVCALVLVEVAVSWGVAVAGRVALKDSGI